MFGVSELGLRFDTAHTGTPSILQNITNSRILYHTIHRVSNVIDTCVIRSRVGGSIQASKGRIPREGKTESAMITVSGGQHGLQDPSSGLEA